MLIMAIGMSLGGTTGYAINPARDLPPACGPQHPAHRGKGTSGWGYSWVPVAGPVLGALAAGAIYGCIYRLQLTRIANPDTSRPFRAAFFMRGHPGLRPTR